MRRIIAESFRRAFFEALEPRQYCASDLDLVGAGLTLSTSTEAVAWSKPVEITLNIGNAGNVGAAPLYDVELALADRSGTGVATLATYRGFSVPPAGQSAAYSLHAKMPLTSPFGPGASVELVARIDVSNTVAEMSESNNDARLPLDIESPQMVVRDIDDRPIDNPVSFSAIADGAGGAVGAANLIVVNVAARSPLLIPAGGIHLAGTGGPFKIIDIYSDRLAAPLDLQSQPHMVAADGEERLTVRLEFDPGAVAEFEDRLIIETFASSQRVEIELVGRGMEPPPATTLGAASQLFAALERARSGRLSAADLQLLTIAIVRSGASPDALPALDYVRQLAEKVGRQEPLSSGELAELTRRVLSASRVDHKWADALNASTSLAAKIADQAAITADDVHLVALSISAAAGAESRLAEVIVDAAQIAWAFRSGGELSADELATLAEDITAAAGGKPALGEAAALATRLAQRLRDGQGITAAEMDDLVSKTSTAAGASALMTDAIRQAVAVVVSVTDGRQPSPQDLAALTRAVAAAADAAPSLAKAIDAATSLVTKLHSRGSVAADDLSGLALAISEAAGAEPRLAAAIIDAAQLAWDLRTGRAPTSDELATLATEIIAAADGKPALAEAVALATRIAERLQNGQVITAEQLEELARKTSAATGASALTTDAIVQTVAVLRNVTNGRQPTHQELAGLARAVAAAAEAKPSLVNAIDAATSLVTAWYTRGAVTTDDLGRLALAVSESAGAEPPLAAAIVNAARLAWAMRSGRAPTAAEFAKLGAEISAAAGGKPALGEAVAFAAHLAKRLQDGHGITTDQIEDLVRRTSSATGASALTTDAIVQTVAMLGSVQTGHQPTPQELGALARAVASAADAKPSLVDAIDAATGLIATWHSQGAVTTDDVGRLARAISEAAGAEPRLAAAIAEAAELAAAFHMGRPPTAAELAKLATDITSAADGKPELGESVALVVLVARQMQEGQEITAEQLDELVRKISTATGSSGLMTAALEQAAGVLVNVKNGHQPTPQELVALARAVAAAADAQPSLVNAIDAATSLVATLHFQGQVTAEDLSRLAQAIAASAGAEPRLAQVVVNATQLAWALRSGRAPTAEELAKLAADTTVAADGKPALAEAVALAAFLAKQRQDGEEVTAEQLQEFVRKTSAATGADALMTDAIVQAVSVLENVKSGHQPTPQELAALARAVTAAADKSSLVNAIDAATGLIAKLHSGGVVTTDDLDRLTRSIGEAAGVEPRLARILVDATQLGWALRSGREPTADELEKLAADITAAAAGRPELGDAVALATRLAKQLQDGQGVTAEQFENLVRKTSAAAGASGLMTDAIVRAVTTLESVRNGRQPTPQELAALARAVAAAADAKPSLVSAVDAATSLIATLHSQGTVTAADLGRLALSISEAAGAGPRLSQAIVDAAQLAWTVRAGRAPTIEELTKLATDIASAAGGKPALVEAVALAATLAKRLQDGHGISAAQLEDLVRKASAATGASASMTDAIIQAAGVMRRLNSGTSPSAEELGALARLVARAVDVKPSLAAAIGSGVELLVKLPVQGVTAADLSSIVRALTTATGAPPAVVALVDQSLGLVQRFVSGTAPKLGDLTSLGQTVFDVFGLADAGQLFKTTVSILETLATNGGGPSLAELQSLTQFAFNVLDLPDAAAIVGRLKVDSLSSLLNSGFNIAAALWGHDIFTVAIGPLRFDIAALALDFACAPLGIPCGSIAQLIVGLFSSTDKNSTPQHIEFSAREEYTARLAKAVWVSTIYDRIEDPALQARFAGAVLSQIDEGIRLAQDRHPDGDKLYYAQLGLTALLRDNPQFLPPAPWLPYVSHNEDHLWDRDRETYSRMAAVWPIFSASLQIYETTYRASGAPGPFDLYSQIVGVPTSEGWPAYNFLYALLQPLTVLGVPETTTDRPAPLGGLDLGEFQTLVAMLADGQQASPGLSPDFSVALAAGLYEPSTMFDRQRLVDLTGRAILRMTPDELGVIYAAGAGQYAVGEWLFDGRFNQTRSLSFLATLQLVASNLRPDEQSEFAGLLWRLLDAIPDERLLVTADGRDPRVELLEALYQGVGQPDLIVGQGESLRQLVTSPNATALFHALDYAGVTVLLSVSALPPPDQISGFSDHPSDLAPPPIVFENTFTRLDTSARAGATCDDVYGDVVIVGGCVTGPSWQSGGEIDFAVPVGDRRYRLASAEGLIDTGGGFLVGHFWGKGIKRRNDTAQIVFEMNDVALHSVSFATERGMYDEFWALSPSQSFYPFEADATDLAITGPFTLSVQADLGAALDIRSFRTRFEFVPAVFTGAIAVPVLDGPVVRHRADPSPAFNWADIANAEDFQVLVQNNWTGEIVAQADGLREPRFTVVSPLAPGGYWVFVRGRNSEGNGAWSRNYVVIDAAATPPVVDPSDDLAAPTPTSVGPLSSEYLWPVSIQLSGPEPIYEGSAATYIAHVEAPGRLETPEVHWRVSHDGHLVATGRGPEIPVAFVDSGEWLIEAAALTSGEVLAMSSLTVQAANVAPTMSLRGPASPAVEGTSVVITALVVDPGQCDESTVRWRLLRDGRVMESATGPAFSFRPADNGVFVVEAVATDNDGGVSELVSTTVVVANMAPVVTGSAPPRAVRGQPLAINVLAIDPSSVDMNDLNFEINFGDGLKSQARGSGAVQFEHVYSTEGGYTFSVTAVDKDGGRSAEITGLIRIGLVESEGNILRIGGGVGKDDIKLQPADAFGALSIVLNAVEYVVPKGVQSIEVFGQAGDDRIVVAARRFGRSTVLFSPSVAVTAGSGNDTIDLRGSSASTNIASGGSGNDLIYGSNGVDLLVGGLGVDRVFGGLGDDYLFGDSLDVEDRIDKLTKGLDDLRSTSTSVWKARQTDAEQVKRGDQLDLNWARAIDDLVTDFLDGGDGTDLCLDLSLARLRLKRS